MIASFLATDGEIADPLDVSAPQANAYEFQSGGVVDMLEKLQDKFQDERNQLEKEEMNAKHAFEMSVQDLVGQIEGATQVRDRHVGNKAQLLQNAAEAKGDLADTQASRAEDSKYLEELNAQCHQKSSDFEARQQLRSEELEAIQKAIEILSSGDVSGAADKHLPGLIQKSFASFRAVAKSPMQASAAAFLQDKATELQSRILSMVALKVQNDPFEKVRKMIKDLIVRLMEEANEEAEHKGWCDTELATNKQTREKKTEQVATLTSEVDKLTADIAKLGEEIGDLSTAIAEIDAAVAHATEIRNKEKAKNAETIKDAKAAQTAVAQALAVLKEFYEKAATATALVQAPEDDAPATFDSAYQGMGGDAGGGGDGGERVRSLLGGVGPGQGRQVDGPGAQGPLKVGQGAGPRGDEQGPQGDPGGARRCARLLRETEAQLRGLRLVVLGPRAAPRGGDPVPQGGAPHPPGRGHRVSDQASSPWEPPG